MVGDGGALGEAMAWGRALAGARLGGRRLGAPDGGTVGAMGSMLGTPDGGGLVTSDGRALGAWEGRARAAGEGRALGVGEGRGVAACAGRALAAWPSHFSGGCHGALPGLAEAAPMQASATATRRASRARLHL